MQIRTHAAAKNTGRIQAARGVPRFEQRSVHAGSAISATRYDIEQPVRIDFVVKADGPARRVALVAHGPDTIDGICSGYITAFILCHIAGRSEERRVGKELCRTCMSRWAP